MTTRAQSDLLQRGLRYMDYKRPSRHYPNPIPRVLSRPSYISPRLRFKQWNIVEGDYVRLLTGRKEDVFENGFDNAEGYKLHKVIQVDKLLNRVFLDGVTSKRANKIFVRDLPENASEEIKQQYNSQSNYSRTPKPVHYSNIQLCVDRDEGGTPVFASRIGTSAPVWNKKKHLFEHNRFAAGKLIGTDDPEKYELDASTGKMRIPWPKPEPRRPHEPTQTDTTLSALMHKTLRLTPVSAFWETPDELPLAPSTRAPATKLSRAISDQYINATIDASSPEIDAKVDALMPLYLSEELSPRFSRAKKNRGKKLADQMLAQEKQDYIKKVVEEWRANDKDRGIKTVLEQAGITDPKIRFRHVHEIREDAAREYDNAVFERKRISKMARRAGGTFDAANDEWIVKVDEKKEKRKRRKRERKMREQLKLMNDKVIVE